MPNFAQDRKIDSCSRVIKAGQGTETESVTKTSLVCRYHPVDRLCRRARAQVSLSLSDCRTLGSMDGTNLAASISLRPGGGAAANPFSAFTQGAGVKAAPQKVRSIALSQV